MWSIVKTKIKSVSFLKIYDHNLNAYGKMILELVYKHMKCIIDMHGSSSGDWTLYLRLVGALQ